MPDDVTAPGVRPPSDHGMTVSVGGAAAAEAVKRNLPASIGRYRILRLLGEGGMGSVYEAEQDRPRRTVALKVIKTAWASPALLHRFELESQVLGRLHHPGIAQIYEAGTADTDFGLQPFFAMEIIHGKPLDQYAAAAPLNTRQRLTLMIQVCEAVEHAHQRGIIHRDLKPGNILVNENGHPKILDFGLARVTDGDMQATRQTDMGQLLGTLAYMSPEQVLADPLELDTRSDVYSLGVILYELLAGKLPYTLSPRVHEVLQTIQQTDPNPLSNVSRVYRGDVETIVAKTLEKDKARRYASAAELAMDIRRYLQDEPIVARPASTSYRMQKFVRRHKALVTGTAAVFLVLCFGIVASTWQAVRAKRAEQTALTERDRVIVAEKASRAERDRAIKAESSAAAERDNARVQMMRANTEAETALAVNQFLQKDLLGQASAQNQARPDQKPDPDLKVRTALDRAAAKTEGAFKDRPLVEASIRQTIGNTYTDLGLYREALPQLEQALKLRLSSQPSDDSDVLSAKNDLAQLYAAQGNVSAALPLVQEVLKGRRQRLGPDHPDTLIALNNLSALRFLEGRLAESEVLQREALRRRMRSLGPQHPDTLESQMNLAAMLQREGKLSEAEELERSAIAGYAKVFGPDHPRTMRAKAGLGDLLLDEKKYPQAEAVLRETLDSELRVLGPEHPATAAVLNSLAMAEEDQGRSSEAEQLYRKSLAAEEKSLGAGHPETINTKHNLALLYQRQGKKAEAEAEFEEVVRLRHQSQGSDLSQLDSELAALGVIRLDLRKFAEAEVVLRESLELREKKDPNGYPRYNSESTVGASLAGQGRYSEAEPFLLSGYEGMRQLGNKLPEFGKPRFKLAGERIVQLYESWGKPEKAVEWRDKLKVKPQ